ncbi:colanic acid/amylovoran biosynthesis glycosyltransferase [Mariniflexile fucanivorans]|uniref:Colanic acid/amylovoran biosynthesis glycosyltransferase n=1 Tax=Mariniflexile fucanivorans TaxID=264023 RepID=A0A4R1RE12_9FLAO|nr:glycosyltransferase family 4 protein [Mariniflexile fucanivorans]TCL63880.1 colanic acid/amylovoran biosynthesis glycosyltransferase [Mariniflexile fucanivorans]
MKSIVIKIQSFPNVSETFVTQATVEAIKFGYEVQIITDKLKSLNNSSQQELILKYNLLDKVIVFKNPKNRFKRRLDFACICFNPIKLYYFIKYCKTRKKISLDYLYYLKFYEQFKNTPVFHIHFATALQPILYLKKIGFLKSKIIVTFHGYDAHYLLERTMLKEMVNDYKTYVNEITTNSQFLKNKLIDKGFHSDQITVVPIGIDTRFFNPGSESKIRNTNELFKLVSVARLTPLKGQEFAIQALKILITKKYKVHLTLVGAGQDENRLKKIVKDLELNEYVSFLGKKSQSEIKIILSNHDLFLMTSTKDKDGRSEAFGVVSLEAQAMGLPIVGFNSGGVSETLIQDQTGYLVEDKNVEAFVNAIQTLYDDMALYKKMSANAIYAVQKKFNIKIMAKQYQMLYEK